MNAPWTRVAAGLVGLCTVIACGSGDAVSGGAQDSGPDGTDMTGEDAAELDHTTSSSGGDSSSGSGSDSAGSVDSGPDGTSSSSSGSSSDGAAITDVSVDAADGVGADASVDAAGGGGADASFDAADGARADANLVDAADGGACAAIPGSAAQPCLSPVSGTLTGAGLSSVICPAGANAYFRSTDSQAATTPYLFTLSVNFGDIAFSQGPTGANSGMLFAYFGVGSQASGGYDSPSGEQCGTMVFNYDLPVPASVDCDAGGGGGGEGCPAGCGRTCTTSCDGIPCEPQPPSVGYTAQGSSDCGGNSMTPIGSWSLSLSSVTADVEDAGTCFAPHGTLTATMVGGADGGSDTITLSASF